MRQWLTALSATSLLVMFPMAVWFLPYDHWDHLWASVNAVLALGLLCVTLCAALVRAESAISLTRKLLRGTAFVALVSTFFGAPAFGGITPFESGLFSENDKIPAAIAIAAALLPAILASARRWLSPLRAAFSAGLFRQSLSIGPVILHFSFSPLRI